jgi:hypothetical protein
MPPMNTAIFASRDDAGLLRPAERDLRLDLLRGVGQWIIFLDHIPYNVVSWLTLRNYGFCDAAEFFVFISGYTAGFVYGPAMRHGQFVAAAKRIFRRAWQLYIAHIFLFLFFAAQISRTALRFDNPMYKDEFNIAVFLDRTDEMIWQALMLKYKPVNLDVLPLYIVLLLATPVLLWGLVRRPGWTLLGSAVLYAAARWFDWNLPSFPGGSWYFNPLAWQLLFVLGIWFGLGGSSDVQRIMRSRAVLILAIAWAIFAFLIVMTWHFESLARFIPQWLGRLIYPIDKTNLDLLRLSHFFALAILIARYLPPNWPQLKSRWLQPMIICGQHSLPLFCLGVFLSFAAHWMLVQISSGIAAQLTVSIVGILLMIAAAYLLNWYKNLPELFQPPRVAGPGTS